MRNLFARISSKHSRVFSHVPVFLEASIGYTGNQVCEVEYGREVLSRSGE